jgi:hypothetical protein
MWASMVFPINCDFSRLRPMPDPRVVDAVILAVFDVATVTFSLSGVKDRLPVGSEKLQRTSIGSSLPRLTSFRPEVPQPSPST